MKRSRMALQRENRDLDQRCSLLAHPNMLRDMERTLDVGKKTRAQLDGLQSTYARLDEQIKTISGKIRTVERRKQSLIRY